MIKIIADNNIPFLKGALEPYAEVVYLPGKEITREVIEGADALLIRTRTKCTESLLKGSCVKFIGTATIGFDHIDTQYCENNNIKWTNAPGCNSSSVQQYVGAALLKIAHGSNFQLKDKTIGIVGVGNVGSKVERFARAMGMRILLNDPPRARNEKGIDFHSLKTILSESDIVTVHVPLEVLGEDCTYNLFNDKMFKKMKNGAWFINSSRGEVTKTSSLKRALESGKIAGAVIDVWENEPDIDQELLAMTFIATPHIAGYSTDGKANGTAMVVNYLCKYFKIPLENWYPQNIPLPESQEIVIEAGNKSNDDIAGEAVYHSYNISGDDKRLRASVSDFEKQRGDYPLRREFPSFHVNLKGGSQEVKKILEDIGFKVIS